MKIHEPNVGEEAELLGKLVDKGWIPPEEAKNYVKLADDQNLPVNTNIPTEFNELACGPEDDTDNVARGSYLLAQQDMLAAGWCKVKL